MINGSQRIYSVNEIKSMINKEWSNDFKSFYFSAPSNVKKYIMYLKSNQIDCDFSDFSHLETKETNEKVIIPQEFTQLQLENDVVIQKPISSFTFFYRPAHSNKKKPKKNEKSKDRELTLHIHDGFDCPLCSSNLFVSNVVVTYSSKEEIKFHADYCKRCRKLFISQNVLNEISPSLENQSDVKYQIIYLKENAT